MNRAVVAYDGREVRLALHRSDEKAITSVTLESRYALVIAGRLFETVRSQSGRRPAHE